MLSKLEFVRAFGTQGEQNGQFTKPISCAFDSANSLYVTDWKNNRVQVFTPEGQFLSAFSNKANNETLYCPLSIAIDSNDTVFVSEEGEGKKYVNIFNTQGEYITAIDMEEQFEHTGTYGLVTNQNDHLIVSDRSYGYLKVY